MHVLDACGACVRSACQEAATAQHNAVRLMHALKLQRSMPVCFRALGMPWFSG
jgi:hypothetical protein